jgi:3-isopropylmalate dehydrogenase
MILSVALMLDWLGDRHDSQAAREAARAIEAAVDAGFSSSGLRTYDIGGHDGTLKVAQVISDLVRRG